MVTNVAEVIGDTNDDTSVLATELQAESIGIAFMSDQLPNLTCYQCDAERC